MDPQNCGIIVCGIDGRADGPLGGGDIDGDDAFVIGDGPGDRVGAEPLFTPSYRFRLPFVSSWSSIKGMDQAAEVHDTFAARSFSAIISE